MRKLRWGRIGSALVIVGLAVPTADLGWLWLTAPTAAPPERATAGTLGCATGEVLDQAVAAHLAGVREATVTTLVRRAAACEAVTPITEGYLDLAHTLTAVTEAAQRSDAAGDHDDALSLAIDVWTVGVEQARAESFVGAMVGLAAGLTARPVVVGALPRASAAASRTAGVRLEALAAVDLPFDDVLARSEALAWSYGLLSPGASALQLPGVVRRYRRAATLDGRSGRAGLEAVAHAHHDPTWRWTIDGALDALELRAHASALATSARLRQALEEHGRCPGALSDLGEVPVDPLTGRDLAYDAPRCLVATGALLDRQPLLAGPSARP